MAVEYNQHTWGYGEELTPDKFNNIEGGVKANADAINEVNNNLSAIIRNFSKIENFTVGGNSKALFTVEFIIPNGYTALLATCDISSPEYLKTTIGDVVLGKTGTFNVYVGVSNLHEYELSRSAYINVLCIKSDFYS